MTTLNAVEVAVLLAVAGALWRLASTLAKHGTKIDLVAAAVAPIPERVRAVEVELRSHTTADEQNFARIDQDLRDLRAA